MAENTFDSAAWVRAYIAGQFENLANRRCTKREYAALIQATPLIPELEEIQEDSVAYWSFYDEEYTWETLFSKKAEIDLSQILKQWLRRMLGELASRQAAAEKRQKVMFYQAMTVYLKDIKHGPMFVEHFLSARYLPELTEKMEVARTQEDSRHRQERELRREIEESRELAAKARRFGGEREERLDEYIDAMENYRAHLFRMYQSEATAELLKTVLRQAQKLTKEVSGLMENMRQYCENYRDEEKLADVQSWECPELLEVFLEKLLGQPFAGCVAALECAVAEKEKAPLQELQKAQRRRASETLRRNRMWIQELQLRRVLELKDAFTCEICRTEAPQGPVGENSLFHLLQFIAQYASGGTAIKERISFSCPGGVDAIWEYLQTHEELRRICQEELEKRQLEEAWYEQALERLP